MNTLHTLLGHIEELIAFHASREARGLGSEATEALRTLREVRAELSAAIGATSSEPDSD